MPRERLPRLGALLCRVDETGRDDVGAHRLEAGLDAALIALEPLAQPLELRPVGSEPDAEDGDPSLRVRLRRRAAPSGGGAA